MDRRRACRRTDLVSDLAIATTGTRVSERHAGDPVVRRGIRHRRPDPQVRAVERARDRALAGRRANRSARSQTRAPARAATRSGSREGRPTGSRLRRGAYAIRLVAVPGDGTRKQSDRSSIASAERRARPGDPLILRPPLAPILASVRRRGGALDVTTGAGVPPPREPVRAARRRSSAGSARSSRSTRTSSASSRQCKKAVEVSIPVAMDDGSIERLPGLPRDAQHRARAVEGRHPLPPGRHARRGQGARRCG